MNRSGLSLGICVATLLAIAYLTTSCAWSVGGREGGTTLQPTQGQELIDLKRARDQGALSEEEYEAQKNKVLAR